MPRPRDYPSCIPYRGRTVLPPDLQAAIVSLSSANSRESGVGPELSSYMLELRDLPAEAISRAAREIRYTAGQYLPLEADTLYRKLMPAAGYRSELSALAKYPQLAYLYIFHPSGLLREAALKCLEEPPNGPFAFVAIAYRLNDWVWQVRDAASACIERLIRQVPPDIIAKASFFLLTQTHQWGRWGPSEREVLDAAIYRPEVMRSLADLMIQARSGHMGVILRRALRKPGLDGALPQLAREAALPNIRAIAYETLIRQQAQWHVGHHYEWIDKRYGMRRRIPTLEQRPLDHQTDSEKFIAEAAQDRAATVRKVAAQGLIDLRHDLSPEMSKIGDVLSRDKTPSVRSRAEFYLNKLRGN